MDPWRYQFGPYEFSPSNGDLRKFGSLIKLQRKPQYILRALLQRAGETVSRQQLHSLLWPEDTFVDFDQGLNVAVKKLRDVLCDSAERPIYIETVAGIGYRFIGEVKTISRPEADNFPGEAPVSPQLPSEAAAIQPTTPNGSPAGVDNANGTGILALARHGPLAALLTLVALASVAIVSMGVLRARSRQPEIRANISFPADVRPVTFGDYCGLALSPDGKQLILSAVGRDNVPQLWIRQMNSLEVTPLAGTQNASFPFWSPEGDEVGFFQDAKLKILELKSNTISPLCDAENGRGGSWSRSGVILFTPSSNGTIYKVRPHGGEAPAPLLTVDAKYSTYRWPVFLPDGEHFVFLAANHEKGLLPADIYLGSLDGSSPKFLFEADSNVQPLPGALVFVSGGKLLKQGFDASNRLPTAAAEVVAEGVGYDLGSWYAAFTTSQQELVYRPRSSAGSNRVVAWFDRQGKYLGNVGRPGNYFSAVLSPDGGAVAAACGDPDENICVIYPDGTVVQLTHAPTNYNVAWSADSSRVAYTTHRGPLRYTVTIKQVSGHAPEREMMHSERGLAPTSWHPDNRHILVARNICTDGQDLEVLDTQTGTVTPYLPCGTAHDWLDAKFSPNGRWVAYPSSTTGAGPITIASYPQPSTTYQVPAVTGIAPRWRQDGRELYFLGPGNMLTALSVEEHGNALVLGTPHPLFRPPILEFPWNRYSFDPDRTGQHFVVNTVPGNDGSGMVLVANSAR